MTKKVSGNWGNWGEFWVFLKALEDGRFALSDMTLSPMDLNKDWNPYDSESEEANGEGGQDLEEDK